MNFNILGIESSCDETAAAVYNSKSGILSSELFSQIDLQKDFGGVVPEVASRYHLKKINNIVALALDKANLNLDDINTIAVTSKPGLPGSLLVGLTFAKALAWAKDKKIIGVNHLEGHVFSSFIEQTPPFPHICLTVSGGHSSLYIVKDFGVYESIGETLDDAAGEAFDKISKFINLGYPGGPIIEKLAQKQNFQDFFKYPRNKNRDLNFSFSGLKTAVLYDLVKKNIFNIKTKKLTKEITPELQEQISSSLLVCIKDIFIDRLNLATKKYPNIKAITFVGGVACNKYLKQELNSFCKNKNLEFFSPSPRYCTDNAAMISLVGNYKAQQNKFDDLSLDILE